MKAFLIYMTNHSLLAFFAVLGVTTVMTFFYLAATGILGETLSSISLGI